MTERSYTSLEQSKEVAKFLPLESADMSLSNVSQRGVNYTEAFSPSVVAYTSINNETKNISKVWEFYPCWSLGALLKNLPAEIERGGIKYRLWLSMQDISYYSVEYDVYLCCTEGEPIDACIEMYKELKKRELI